MPAEANPAKVEDQLSSNVKAGEKRKRRRGPEDEDAEDVGSDLPSSQDLKEEVKKLKRELREKDERLKRLEAQMEWLTRVQPKV